MCGDECGDAATTETDKPSAKALERASIVEEEVETKRGTLKGLQIVSYGAFDGRTHGRLWKNAKDGGILGTTDASLKAIFWYIKSPVLWLSRFFT